MDKDKTQKIAEQVRKLNMLSLKQLSRKYQKVFMTVPTAANKAFIIHKLAYKLQEDAFGGLSGDARTRLETLKFELNPIIKLGKIHNKPGQVPFPGTVITKVYKGREIRVKVLAHGFEYEGKIHKSISRVAREITGVNQSGFQFFGL